METHHNTACRLLRETIVNRTYDTHKNLNVQPFLLTIFGPVNYGPPQYQVNAFRVPHTAIAYPSAISQSEGYGKSYTAFPRDNQR